MLQTGDVLFTSRRTPIWLWQQAMDVPNAEMTRVGISYGSGVVFEAMPLKRNGLDSRPRTRELGGRACEKVTVVVC